MNNNEETKKSLTIGTIIGYLVGIGSAIAGVMMLLESPLAGVLYLLIAAITLPPIVDKTEEKFGFHLSKPLRIIAVLILAGIIGTQLSNDALSNLQNSNDISISDSIEETPAAEVELETVSALALSTAYNTNSVAADSQYKGKKLNITGVVDNIDEDITGEPYVTLEGNNTSLFGVQCMFGRGNQSAVVNLSPGQSVTLQGEVSGELIGNVLVRGCSIVN